MESSESALLPPPILRLSADIWSHLSALLAPGDLIRLCSTGCSLLASIIGLGAETVTLRWNISRYMEFEEVFASLQHFKSLRELDFASAESKTLYWMPINWTLLPSSLVFLRLAFLDSLSALLQNASLKSICPRLELLDLSDVTTYNIYYQPRELNLQGLPESLRSLTLASTRIFGIHLPHFEMLPNGLETLDLDLIVVDASRTNKFGGDVLRQSQDGSSSKLLFPRVPDSITSLRLFGYEVGSFWHVDFASLPKSLQKFEFVDMVGGPSLSEFDSLDSRTYNMTGAATHLEHLHTLIYTAAYISPQEALTLIPSSVTKLSITIASTGTEHLKEVLESIAPRLTMFSSNAWPELDEAIFVEKKVALPLLDEVFFLDKAYSDIPPSVKHLTTTTEPSSLHLTELETIEIYPVFDHPDSAQSLLSYSFGQKLREFSFDLLTIPAEVIDLLPNTLEAIRGDINAEAWDRIISRMNMDDSGAGFPRLAEIANRSALPIDLLAGLPKQLKQLYFHVQRDSMAHPLSDLLKASLPNAQLESLTMTIMQDERTNQTQRVIELLNILPLSLHTFNLAGQSLLASTWPVKFPPKLVELKYRQVKDDVEALHSSLYYAHLEFPSSLQVLKLVGNIDLPHHILPPYLSTFSKCSITHGLPIDNGNSYFSQVIPLSNKILQEHDYKSTY